MDIKVDSIEIGNLQKQSEKEKLYLFSKTKKLDSPNTFSIEYSRKCFRFTISKLIWFKLPFNFLQNEFYFCSSSNLIFIKFLISPFLHKQIIDDQKPIRIATEKFLFDCSSAFCLKFKNQQEFDDIKTSMRNYSGFKIYDFHDIPQKNLSIMDDFDPYDLTRSQNLDFENLYRIKQIKSEHGHKYSFDNDRRILDQNEIANKKIEPTDKKFCFVKKIEITPTRFIFKKPQFMLGNRIVRKHDANNFVIVSFRDENSKQIPTLFEDCENIIDRIKKIIQNGIKLGKYHLKFVGFSNSQLKDMNFWFVLESVTINETIIRSSLGDFSKCKSSFKFFSRVGLAFSSSQPTIPVKLTKIDDISTPDGKYNFTDGCGFISFSAAKKVQRSLGLKECPSLFQIRCAGLKGVLQVLVEDSTIDEIFVRESMWKFDGK